MIIKKGTVVEVSHSRSGNWRGIATKTFDTVKDEWYSLALYQEDDVHGLSTSWEQGEEMPARRGLCTIKVVKNAKPTVASSSITVDEFGKDHWSLFAYIETRCVDHKGVLDLAHMRTKNSRLN